MTERGYANFPVLGFLAVALAGAWLLLSGMFTGLHLGLGALSVAVALWAAYALHKKYGSSGLPAGAGFLFYPLWLEGQIIAASFKTLGVIFSPRPITPEAIWANYGELSPAGIALYAHSVTLTPGTVSLYVDVPRRRIMVHALTASDADAIADGAMLEKIAPYFSVPGGAR